MKQSKPNIFLEEEKKSHEIIDLSITAKEITCKENHDLIELTRFEDNAEIHPDWLIRRPVIER